MTSGTIEPRRVVAETSLLEFRQFLEEDGRWDAAEAVGERVLRKKCTAFLGAMESDDDTNDDSLSIASTEFEVTGEDSWPEFLTRVWDDGLDFVLDAFIEILDAIADVPVFHFTLRLLFRFHMLE